METIENAKKSRCKRWSARAVCTAPYPIAANPNFSSPTQPTNPIQTSSHLPFDSLSSAHLSRSCPLSFLLHRLCISRQTQAAPLRFIVYAWPSATPAFSTTINSHFIILPPPTILDACFTPSSHSRPQLAQLLSVCHCPPRYNPRRHAVLPQGLPPRRRRQGQEDCPRRRRRAAREAEMGGRLGSQGGPARGGAGAHSRLHPGDEVQR
jgi:hypothetical protein